MPRGLSIVLTLLYPALIYFGSRYVSPSILAIAFLPLLLLRGGIGISVQRWVVPGVAILVALAVIFNNLLPLKLYPAFMNIVFLAVFAASLRYPPSVIERIARLREPDLPSEGVAYTRRVTQVWCGFFVINGGIALWSALWASDRVWFWYNGVIVYALMGTLLAGEWLVRQRVRHG